MTDLQVLTQTVQFIVIVGLLWRIIYLLEGGKKK